MVETHQRTKYRQNWSIGCEDINNFRFFKMAAVRYLAFVWANWTTNGEYLGVSITLQNLVIIDAVVLIIWTFQYLARLAGKRLFTPIGAFEQFDPLNGLKYQRKPKRRESASFEPLSVKIWGALWPVGESLKKRGINKKFGLYFTYLPKSSLWRDYHQILHSCRRRGRNHLWQTFWRSVKGRRFCGGEKWRVLIVIGC